MGMTDKESEAWDASTVVAPGPAVGRPKYAMDSVDGVWYPRSPIMDGAVLVDISLLSGTGLPVLPALPQISYILGPPSIVVVNPLAFSAVGFSGSMVGTIFDANGNPQETNFCPLGGGFAASPSYFKTRPGFEVDAVMWSTAPAAGVAYLWVPYTKVVSPV